MPILPLSVQDCILLSNVHFMLLQVTLNLESSAKKARRGGKPSGGKYWHGSGAFSADNPYGKKPKAIAAA